MSFKHIPITTVTSYKKYTISLCKNGKSKVNRAANSISNDVNQNLDDSLEATEIEGYNAQEEEPISAGGNYEWCN